MNRPYRPSDIISFYKLLSSDRDVLSLYFEYIGKGFIKANRFFYKSDTYIEFLNKEFNEEGPFNYQNIKTTSYVISCDDFHKTIIYLANALENTYHEKSSLLFESLRGFKETNSTEEYGNDYSVERVLKEINHVLKGYQYCFGGSHHYHYFNEELTNAINQNIELVPNIENPENIDIPALLPAPYQIIDNPELFELRVYSVGQANCSALIKYIDNSKADYNVVAVFDFGLENGKRNADLKKMISKIDENTTIVVSHFDLDHINNITKFDLIKTCRWLFPEHEPDNEDANLIYHELLKVAFSKSRNGKQVFSYKAPYSLSNYLRINQNTTGRIGDYRYQSTLVNAQSIIVSLSINGTNVLVPADALYRDFPEDVFNYTYNYVLIPHHGCRYGDNTNSSPYYDEIKKITYSEPVGIVMCGKDGKRYGHANTSHLSWYSNIIAFDDASFFLSRFIEDKKYYCPIITGCYFRITFC